MVKSTTPSYANDNTRVLGGEYYVEPVNLPIVDNTQAAADTKVEEIPPVSDHSGSGFCYKPACSCKTNPHLIQALIGHVKRGTASADDMCRIYRGRTI